MAGMWVYGEPVDGILHVEINLPGRSANALSRQSLDDLAALIEHVKHQSELRGVVFKSGKPGTFIVGADVQELQTLRSAQAAQSISRHGHKVFTALESLKTPTVALISGACLGGGLEFAMSCKYRVADDHSKTRIGLPEVMLGLLPAWGGTVRLPRLIGLPQAAPLILTGRMLNSRQAKSKGIVHDVVPNEALDYVGQKIIETNGAALPRPRKSKFKRWIERNGLVGRFVLSMAERGVKKQTHGHYPSPLLIIDALRQGLSAPPESGFNAEAEAVAKLAENPVTTELMRLFLLSEEAKKPPEYLRVEPHPESLSLAAVIGAGAMGAGIALLMAEKGIWVRLKDLKPEFVAKGMATIRTYLKSNVARKKMTPLQASNALDRISPRVDYAGLKGADVVIEAVLENINVKRQVFQEVAAASGPETVLATNTSSLLVSEIAQGVPHPERVVGVHFFNPPHRMQLVEIVRTEETSDEAVAKAFALVSRLGKTGIIVGDCTGFLVNRLLSPYMNEAGQLLAEVSDPMEIERAAIDFGMPMGPLELTELVGLDVAAHVSKNMHAAYGDRMEPAPIWSILQATRPGQSSKPPALFEKRRFGGMQLSPVFRRAVADAQGRLKARLSRPLSRQDIIERLVYPIINEAAMCLDEGIAHKPEDIDLAMVFGTGFAPFRGGPLRYAESIGVPTIVSTLDRLSASHPRLAPSAALRTVAESGGGFAVIGPYRAHAVAAR